jgi:hypothetical protein
MASTNEKWGEIKSHQSLEKSTSLRRACHNLSNDINSSSNEVMDRKISEVKFLVNLAQSAGMSQHLYY